jgi:bifunctional DNA-binding transcriptional regulator/antitoxin component of YhaV-PrlF toxin-antitoxin module
VPALLELLMIAIAEITAQGQTTIPRQIRAERLDHVRGWPGRHG